MTDTKIISLIIPARNEESNISNVLEVAKKVKEIDEIIVVADACTDKTAEIAKTYSVRILKRKKSKGKGDAMLHGVRYSKGNIIMFIDADLKDLNPGHIKSILKPIISNQAEISIGLRDRVLGLSALIPQIFPSFAISGERAMSKSFFNSIPKDENIYGFGIEVAINLWAKKNNLKIAYPLLPGLKQTIKEKKWGIFKGFLSRIKLIYQIIKSQIFFRFK